MMIIFHLLLMLRVGRSADDLVFAMKTVSVGDNVTLSCTRHPNALYQETLYWIKLGSGNLPEFLGGTYTFDYKGGNKTPHVTTKQEPGTYILHINKAELSDTGVYYCIKVKKLDMTFVNGASLRIKGPEPDITAVIQELPSDPVHPGIIMTLQCSVLSNSENKTCPGDHRVFWFRAGSDDSHPSLIYVHGDSGEECERSPEPRSAKKCFYNFSKNVTSSDAGTYYCGVATCGEIIFGNGRRVDVEALSMWELKKANMVLILLSVALAASLIVIVFLIYTIKNKTCDRCNDAVTASGYQQNQQRGEDSLIYSAPTFTRKKAGKAERRNMNAAEKDTVYSEVQSSKKAELTG
ncbi:uncharacterized protein [Embiotoca jacksoni]|uniref:uncharacterized protein n=1 Tax=Embiotoca jacksoni TaxID=100190 RepID=UPI0037040094